jgi:hypothetical protein
MVGLLRGTPRIKKTMKKNLSLLIGLLAIAGSVTITTAQPSPQGVAAWSAFTSYTVGATNFACSSVNGLSGEAAALTYINATTDFGGPAVSCAQFWGPALTPPVILTAMSNSTVSLYMAAPMTAAGGNTYQTNGIAANVPLVIRHLTNDTYEVRLATAVSVSANQVTNALATVTLSTAPTQPVFPGDLVYPYIPDAMLQGTNISIITGGAGSYIYIGKRNYPILVSGTNTAASKPYGINLISGTFLP